MPLSIGEARQIWSSHQALGSAADALTVPGGWMRALGGVDPYLSLRARCADISREAIDRALADGGLWILPGVRGCIWMVPAQDAALALKVGDAQYRKRNEREMARLEVSDRELSELGEAVIEALGRGPLSPDDLRQALPEGSWRSLGDKGKKLGHSTTLPTALRYLEGEGRIRRRLEGGRLDTQRYEWALSEGLSPFTVSQATEDGPAQLEALARRFFSWAAPATADEFIAWTGLGKRVCRKALAALEPEEVVIEGLEGPALWSPEQARRASEIKDDPAVYFLPAQDNLLTLRASAGLVARPEHHDIPLMGMNMRKRQPLSQSRWLNQRPLVHRGEWIGLWSWHLDEERVIFAGFSTLEPALRKSAEEEAEALSSFIKAELGGSCRANGIDSPRAQRARMDFVLGMMG